MVLPPEGSCSLTIGLLRRPCEHPAIATCVYCGRGFCAQHGERGRDYTDTCSRKACRTKFLDVMAHQEWKQANYKSNKVSVCAREECSQRMRHQCSRCRLMFCDEHVEDFRVERNPRTATVRLTRALICEHCRSRRRLWE